MGLGPGGLCKVRAGVRCKADGEECGVPRGDPEREGREVTNGTARDADQVTSNKRDDCCAVSGLRHAGCEAITPCDTPCSPPSKVFSDTYH